MKFKMSKRMWLILGIVIIIIALVLIYSYTSDTGMFTRLDTFESAGWMKIMK